MKKLILLLLLIPIVSFGQNDGVELCYKLGNRSFNTNADAINSLEKILAVANLKPNRFVIIPCDNVGNALAGVYQGFRYILYNTSWMNQNDDWGKMAVLAHEVGHHINGHTLSGYSLRESRQVELEADDWAGYAMAKLGASLAETLQLTKRFPTGDDTNSTHPNRAKRIAALTSGWNTGNETIPSKRKEKYVPDNSNMSASEYWNRAYGKYEAEDYYGAIADYTKSLELAPNNSSAYYNRAIAKSYLKDFNGAISDCTKAIELAPNYTSAYYNRANAKADLEDYNGAIADYSKAIELDPNYTSAYNNRAIAKYYLKDFNGAISDCTKAIELDPNYTNAYKQRFKAKILNKEYKGVISDIFKTGEIVFLISFIIFGFYFMCFMCFSKWAEKYIWMRHKHKIQIDVSKRNEAIGYLKKGNQEFKNKQFVDAIKYYTKAIEINVDFKEAYANRAKARKALGDIKGYNEDKNMFATFKSKTKNRQSFLTKTSVENNYFYLQNIFEEFQPYAIIWSIAIVLVITFLPFFEVYIF